MDIYSNHDSETCNGILQQLPNSKGVVSRTFFPFGGRGGEDLVGRRHNNAAVDKYMNARQDKTLDMIMAFPMKGSWKAGFLF